MHLISLNTSILKTFAIFSVSPHFLKLFFYSKKHKRIFALKSNVEDNDDIFNFLKKNAGQHLFSIKSLAQNFYKTGIDPNRSPIIENFLDKVSFGMTPNEFINKSILTLEHYNRGEVPYPNKIYFWNYNNQLQNPFSGDYCPKSIKRDILNRRKMIDIVSEDNHFKRGFFVEWITKEVEKLCSNDLNTLNYKE